jgi:hypothetical protein
MQRGYATQEVRLRVVRAGSWESDRTQFVESSRFGELGLLLGRTGDEYRCHECDQNKYRTVRKSGKWHRSPFRKGDYVVLDTLSHLWV